MDLAFRADGSFTIAQFTDLHLTDGKPEDIRTVALLTKVLAQERPDLVILTGDIIAGTATPVVDSASAWRMALQPIVAAGIPFAVVFGNHDDEGDLDRRQMVALLQTYPGCVLESGPTNLPGAGHYVIDLVTPQAAQDGQVQARAQAKAQSKARARLYFLDSLGNGPEGVSRYDWLKPEQIDWFRQQAQDATSLTGLVFFHIPLPEYDQVWNMGVCVGNKHEKVCCPSVNSGMFAALRESGAVAGVFVGHDHINDYEGTLDGIRLCYGRAGGYGSYGQEQFPRGARLIRLHASRVGFDTWLRLEDGSEVRQGGAIK